MSSPLVSIIIPHYNHAKELQKTLESVFGQTFFNSSLRPPTQKSGGSNPEHLRDRHAPTAVGARDDKQIEVIVADDGSSQSQISNLKFQILPKFPQVKFIFAEHRGAAAARNRGFQESSGQYVIFWDADIVARPEMLEKMKKALDEHPEASYAYSSFKFGWKIFECGLFDSERLKKVNYITTASLIRRGHFPGFSAQGEPASGWDESLEKFQDWDLWLTMLEHGHAGVWIPEVLFTVKPRRTGISAWLPSFIYKFPWLPIPALRKYRYWKKIILEKHHIEY